MGADHPQVKFMQPASSARQSASSGLYGHLSAIAAKGTTLLLQCFDCSQPIQYLPLNGHVCCLAISLGVADGPMLDTDAHA